MAAAIPFAGRAPSAGALSAGACCGAECGFDGAGSNRSGQVPLGYGVGKRAVVAGCAVLPLSRHAWRQGWARFFWKRTLDFGSRRLSERCQRPAYGRVPESLASLMHIKPCSDADL